MNEPARVTGATSPDDQLAGTNAEDSIRLIDSMVVEAVGEPLHPENARGAHDLPSLSDSDSMVPAEDWVGRHVGPYLITGTINAGTTTDGFHATRVNDSTQQLVVKLINCKTNSDVVIERFRAAQKACAALREHPYINALLDIGATSDGYVYFVTNDIDGLPIDRYCDQERLTISARLKLFSEVCNAVLFAHWHAVLHRNLTPHNIIITDAGIPQIIDFGFAELLQRVREAHNANVGSTATSGGLAIQILSPEYASPEQVLDEPITTASDVYSLGLVLYLLLTGRPAYRLHSQSHAEVFRAICEQVPEKPSIAATSSRWRNMHTADEIASNRRLSVPKLKRRLHGDLDSIVLMALRKEDEWRYRSIEQLNADLDRHMKGLPLLAHADTLVYRASKIPKSYPRAVSSAVILLVLLISFAIGITTNLAVARRERDRALRSLERAHNTADQLVTHIFRDRTLKQSGLSALRQSLLLDARQFYEDMLAEHAEGAPRIADDAAIYARLAEIERVTGSSTPGRSRSKEAIALWRSLVAEYPENHGYQIGLIHSLSSSGEELLVSKDRLNEALLQFQEALVLIERLLARQPGPINLQAELASIVVNIAEIQTRQGKATDAVNSLERVCHLDGLVTSDDPQSIELRVAQATAHARLGRLYGFKLDRLLEATSAYDQAIELMELLARDEPRFTDHSYQLALTLSELSLLQQRMGQLEPALQSIRRVLQIFEQISGSNPKIALYQEGLGTTCNTLSDLERQKGEPTEALAFARRAQGLFEKLLAEDSHNNDYRRNLARSFDSVGKLLAQSGKPEEALRALQRSIDLLESLTRLDSRDSYGLACTAAFCIPLIGSKLRSGGAPSELNKRDQGRQKRYGDRAIEALRQSATGGFLNIENLQNESAFDSLRSRADFQSLLRDAERMPSAGEN